METMKTIVFAASKGGVGKTTLAFNIAVEAAKKGSVFVADMDPQKSLETFMEIRGGDNPILLRNVQSIPRLIEDIQRNRLKCDFLIIDTPGSFMNIIKDAVTAADCVIVPMQPSPIDILAQEDVLLLVDQLGKKKITLPALSRVDGRTGVDDVLKRIMTMFANPHAMIKNRIVYARALVAGKAAPEIDRECQAEISGLWEAIQRITGDGNERTRRKHASAQNDPRPRKA
jgi:chromosome partitioning protein